MYEEANARNATPAHTFYPAAVTVGDDWAANKTVEVEDEDDATSQLRVHPGVSAALRRAALLYPVGLCRLIQLGVHESEDPNVGLEIVSVYWEG